jgi:hypothetical protein
MHAIRSTASQMRCMSRHGWSIRCKRPRSAQVGSPLWGSQSRSDLCAARNYSLGRVNRISSNWTPGFLLALQKLKAAQKLLSISQRNRRCDSVWEFQAQGTPRLPARGLLQYVMSLILNPNHCLVRSLLQLTWTEELNGRTEHGGHSLVRLHMQLQGQTTAHPN